MSWDSLGRFIALVLNGALLGFVIYRITKVKDRIRRTVGLNLLASSVLLFYVSVFIHRESLRQDLPWWSSVTANVSMQLVVVLVFFNAQLLINRKEFSIKQALLHPLVIVTLTISTVMVVVDVNRRDHFVSVTDPYAFEATPVYLVSHLAYAVALLIPLLCTHALLRRDWQRYQKRTFRTLLLTSTGLILISFSLSSTTLIVEIANTIGSYFVDNPYRVAIYRFIQEIARPIIFATCLAGSILTARVSNALLFPARTFASWRRRHFQDEITYLHRTMIQIVPDVQLPEIPAIPFSRQPTPATREHPLVIEIADARRRIWSYHPRVRPLTARDESKLLARLSSAGTTYEKMGDATPPVLRQNEIDHNVAVARRLRKLLKPNMTVPPLSTTIPHLPGSVLQHLRRWRSDRLSLFQHVRRACGPIGAFSVGPSTLVLIHDPDDIRRLLVDYAPAVERHPRINALLAPLAGQGLLTSSGADHLQQRRMLAPLFQPKALTGYESVITTYASDLQAAWSDQAIIHIDLEMRELTLRIIGKVLFNADVTTDAQDFGKALETVLRWANKGAGALLPIPPSWPTPNNRRLRAAVMALDGTLQQLIDRQQTAAPTQRDLVSLLLHATDEHNRPLTATQVRDQAMTLFTAGHETTATALTWTWYLLSRHPEAYGRLRAEVDHVLQGRCPTIADLPRLPFLLQVLKESLRLYPPAYLIVRKTKDVVRLSGTSLPPGTNVGISLFTLHRQAEYYPEPERFDPDRWLPEAEHARPQYAFIPFGAGPHACIGSHFAMLEAQLVLAVLVQRVVFEALPGQQIEPEPLVTLQVKGHIRMRVHRRQV